MAINLKLADAYVDVRADLSHLAADLSRARSMLGSLGGGGFSGAVSQGVARGMAQGMTQGARAGGGGGGGFGGLGASLAVAGEGATGLAQGLGVAGLAFSPMQMAGQVLGSQLRGAVSTAMDLESTFVGLRQVTGESAENVGRFKQTVFEIAKSQAGVSVADVAGIAMAGAKAGITDKEGIAGLETFTRSMAKVKNAMGGGEGLSTEQLTEDMTRMMYLFGKSTDYIESMGSALVRMANVSTASAGSIAQMTKALSGTTASLGSNIPETMAFASVMADAGLTAQQGASSFSQIFRLMASKGETFAGAAGVPIEQWTQLMNTGQLMTALKLLTDKFHEIQEVDPTKAQEWIAELGFRGVRTAGAFQQVATLMDKVAERVAMAKEEETTLGALTAANELRSTTAISNIQKLTNAYTELGDAIGGKVIGPLTELAKVTLTAVNQLGREPGKAGPDKAPTKPLSFAEGLELTGRTMLSWMGGAIPKSPGFQDRINELKGRVEGSFAAGDNKALAAAAPTQAERIAGLEKMKAGASPEERARLDAVIAREKKTPEEQLAEQKKANEFLQKMTELIMKGGNGGPLIFRNA
jgi:TP901 family phage tail tape measure protein